MKRFFLLMSVLLLSSLGFILTTEALAQTNEKRIYSCAFDGFVNMREKPSFSADKVGKFNNGPDGAILLEKLGDWVKIDASGTIGYVPTKYTQETPTIPYTGKASADWIEGVWSLNRAHVLLVYNNGTWEAGYDYTTSKGTYIMQNNEIKFTRLWIADGMSCVVDEILPIKMEENKLGDWERDSFLTLEELEESGQSEDDYAFEYGVITKKDFKKQGKLLLEELERQANTNSQYANNLSKDATEGGSSVSITGLEWILGDWKGSTYDFVTHEDTGPVYLRITPTYYQLSYEHPITDGDEKTEYTLTKYTNEYGIGEYWIDKDNGICFTNSDAPDLQTIDIIMSNAMYTLSKYDPESEARKEFWHNTGKPLSFLISTALGILLLFFFIRCIIRLIKKNKERIATKARETKEKALELGSKAKEKASSISVTAMDKVKDISKQTQEAAKSIAQSDESNNGGDKNKAKKIKTWTIIAILAFAIFAVIRTCGGSDGHNYDYDDYDYDDSYSTEQNYNSERQEDEKPSQQKSTNDLIREELNEVNQAINHEIQLLQRTPDPRERDAIRAEISLLQQRAQELQMALIQETYVK